MGKTIHIYRVPVEGMLQSAVFTTGTRSSPITNSHALSLYIAAKQCPPARTRYDPLGIIFGIDFGSIGISVTPSAPNSGWRHPVTSLHGCVLRVWLTIFPVAFFSRRIHRLRASVVWAHLAAMFASDTGMQFDECVYIPPMGNSPHPTTFY